MHKAWRWDGACEPALGPRHGHSGVPVTRTPAVCRAGRSRRRRESRGGYLSSASVHERYLTDPEQAMHQYRVLFGSSLYLGLGG